MSGVLNSLHDEGQTQRGTQGSEASVSTVDTTSSISNSQSTTFISRGMYLALPHLLLFLLSHTSVASLLSLPCAVLCCQWRRRRTA
jgi:hypothetical protein